MEMAHTSGNQVSFMKGNSRTTVRQALEPSAGLMAAPIQGRYAMERNMAQGNIIVLLINLHTKDSGLKD